MGSWPPSVCLKSGIACLLVGFTVLCKLVGTLKVLASSTCSNYSTVFNLISTVNVVRLKTAECLFSYYRYLKLRPNQFAKHCNQPDELMFTDVKHMHPFTSSTCLS